MRRGNSIARFTVDYSLNKLSIYQMLMEMVCMCVCVSDFTSNLVVIGYEGLLLTKISAKLC